MLIVDAEEVFDLLSGGIIKLAVAVQTGTAEDALAGAGVGGDGGHVGGGVTLGREGGHGPALPGGRQGVEENGGAEGCPRGRASGQISKGPAGVCCCMVLLLVLASSREKDRQASQSTGEQTGRGAAVVVVDRQSSTWFWTAVVGVSVLGGGSEFGLHVPPARHNNPSRRRMR